MSERKLASAQRIVKLEPIPGADKIEKATVLGWQCVVAKTEGFKVGDLVCYIEVDSIVPETKEFEFLKDRKYRIKTIKLRGQVSQGLVTHLPKGNFKEGDDLTDVLGIKKYDPQGDLERKLALEQAQRQNNKIKSFLLKRNWFTWLFAKRQGFPNFVKKTDEDRIQLFPNIVETERNTPFEITEKLDGQSATYVLVKKNGWFGKKYDFIVCSRNLSLPKPDNSSYWTIAKQLNIRNVLEQLIGDGKFIVLQGEIVGGGIQGNKYGISGYDFYAFNLVLPTGQCQGDVMRYALRGLVQCVPLLGEYVLPETIAECVEMAKGNSVIANVKREGIVIRNYQKKISLKIINPDFLLEYSE